MILLSRASWRKVRPMITLFPESPWHVIISAAFSVQRPADTKVDDSSIGSCLGSLEMSETGALVRCGRKKEQLRQSPCVCDPGLRGYHPELLRLL